jgi:hypothetical protein
MPERTGNQFRKLINFPDEPNANYSAVFVVSLIYASVGFGGGSSYLAILAMYDLPFREMRLIALICNIIVVTGGTLAFCGINRWPGRRSYP